MRYLIKLVRDRLDGALPPSHIEYGPVTMTEHVEGLRKKLIEEAAEYVVKPGVEELADLLETAESLACVDLTEGLEGVRRAQVRKRGERGGFIDGLGLYAVDDAR